MPVNLANRFVDSSATVDFPATPAANGAFRALTRMGMLLKTSAMSPLPMQLSGDEPRLHQFQAEKPFNHIHCPKHFRRTPFPDTYRPTLEFHKVLHSKNQ